MKVVLVVYIVLTMQRRVEMDLMSAGDGQAEVRNDTAAVCGCSRVCTWLSCSSWHDEMHQSHVTLQHPSTDRTQTRLVLVMRRLSNRNRKSNTLATIERDRNRDISEEKCDFDHALLWSCTRCGQKVLSLVTSHYSLWWKNVTGFSSGT